MKAERRKTVRSLQPFLLASVLLPAAAPASEPVSFASDVQPILTQHCVMCHLPGAAQGDHSLYPDAWASMVNVPSVQSALKLVEPGSPETSYSYLKLTGKHREAGGSGEVMPFPNGPLSADVTDIFRLWIEQGAKRN